MDIIVDKRDSDIIYVDKINNHAANNNSIIKLINNTDCSIIDIYTKILAGFNNLNNTEVEIIKYIITNNNVVALSDIYDNVSKIINKSVTTVSRGINALRNKRLIYINDLNYVIISNSIVINTSKIKNADFIVIELNPKITSKSISI